MQPNTLLCISVKLKNLKANHNNPALMYGSGALCISVKLKNLKANHNFVVTVIEAFEVVYIRKVKKSESKSQHTKKCVGNKRSCVYP